MAEMGGSGDIHETKIPKACDSPNSRWLVEMAEMGVGKDIHGHGNTFGSSIRTIEDFETEI